MPAPSPNGSRRSIYELAMIAALSLAACGPSAMARPRTWADQDMTPAKQPNWMPFAVADRTPNQAVARITAVEGNTLSQGSGTLVDVRGQHGLIVTNWHVIRDAKGPVVATFPDGFRSAATVLKTDADWDLAALLIWRPTASPIAISTTAPRPGDPLTIAGYGAGSYRAVTGRCTQYVAPGMHLPYEIVEVSGEARQGDSGGPILNERGELAGVLFGAGDGATSGSYCGRVLWFLDSVWPAEHAQDADTLVSVPAHQPNERWPPDSLAPVAQVPTERESPFVEPAPNYSIGSALTPTTRSATELQDSGVGLDFSAIAGTTPVEQAKAILAAIGILAIVLQVARAASVNTTKKA